MLVFSYDKEWKQDNVSILIRTSDEFCCVKSPKNGYIRQLFFRAFVQNHLKSRVSGYIEKTKKISKQFKSTLTGTIHPLPSKTSFIIPTLPSSPTHDSIEPTLRSIENTSEPISTEESNGPIPSQDTEPISLPDLSNNYQFESAPTSWDVVREKYKDVPPELSIKPQLRKIGSLPARNPLEPNPRNPPQRKGYNLYRLSNLRAALLQVAGDALSGEAQCTNCQAGKGPWNLCVVGPSNDIFGACANCSYNGRNTICNLYKPPSKYLIHIKFK